MKYETKSKMLFFFLGVVITLLFVVTATSIGAEKINNLTNLNNQNSNMQNIDVNTPTAELQQNLEDERNKPSPNNFFSEDQIKVYKDRVILNAENIQWASFEDTKSMLPVLSNESNALQIVPKCPEEIQLGDIISYVSEYADGIIIHRVVFIGNDDDGTYFVLKGDNNPSSDPGKIRCEQIQRKVVAIIY
jgi:hypothetical protein